ncbi:MAG: hypothetical protein H6601_03170 [Flavobacteriales bacterium]|nr:hypothetical protein [Flavobacteriales bacterium]
MIRSLIQWLSEHRAVNLALVVGYAAFIVFAHEWFVYRSVDIMNSLSIPVYDRLVAVIVAAALISVVLMIYRGIRQWGHVNRYGVVFLLLTLTGLIIHFFMLTEMNIEFIHAVEFGLLSVLIYPLTGRFGGAIALALPVMMFDEWYQYQVLFDFVDYYELNDIVLDLLGAGLFLSVLKMFNLGVSIDHVPISKRVEVYLLLILVFGIVLGLVTGWIAIYSETASEHTWLVLNAIKEPYGFWRVHPLIGSSYHVLEPISGLAIVFALSFGYLLMDSSRPVK